MNNDGKVTDLQIKGENFEGKYAKENENIYLPKAINKIKDQIQGLDITNQNSFDKVDTVSGATTSASAIKNAVMESLGLTSKEEVLAPAPETVEEGTYGIQMKNMTSTVEHSLSAANSENKVTATLKVDKNGKMTLSYPVVTKEAMDVLAFNGYYNGSDLTKEGSEETKDGESVTTVNMPLTGDKPELTYKANFKMYVPAMSNLSGEHGGITFDHGKFDTDAQITLYWDTLKEKKDKEVLSDGIYKVDAKMLKTNGKDLSMANDAIAHKVKLTVKDETALGKLMHDFTCTNAKDMYYEVLADRVHYFKEDEKGVAIMCKAMEDMRNEAAREAEKMKAIRMARLMVEDGKLSYEDIAAYTELTIEEVEKIASEKKSA